MSNQEVNRDGCRKVEAELLQRGAGSVIFGKSRKSLLYATNSEQSRTVGIRVKTKRKGNWHTTTNEAKPADTKLNVNGSNDFWVFVDMAGVARYWIVPDWWIRNDIHQAHEQYLNNHKGHRPKNDASNHHSIDETRLNNWQNKWEILDIF